MNFEPGGKEKVPEFKEAEVQKQLIANFILVCSLMFAV
jgi:hypothetical protein